MPTEIIDFSTAVIFCVYMHSWIMIVNGNTLNNCTTRSCPAWCNCYFMYENNTHIQIKMDCSSANQSAFPTDQEIPFCSHEGGVGNDTSVQMRLTINLSGNRISSISLPQSTGYLKYIDVLDLSNNLLTDLSNFPLLSLTSLRILLLHNNNLSFLPKNFKDDIPRTIRLVEISLYGNPWTCECHHNWMYYWLRQHRGMIRQVDWMRCDWPDGLKGDVLINTTAVEWICHEDAPERDRFPPYAIVIIILVIVYLIICAVIALCVTCRNRHKVKVMEPSVIYKIYT